MTIVQTTLDWIYSPPDFFEAPIVRQTPDYELNAVAGKITVRLNSPADPVPDTLIEGINAYIDVIFRARAMRTHRSYSIDGPGICHLRDDGGRNVVVKVQPISVIVSTGTVDFVVTDPSGKIVADSKAERISRDEAFNRFLEDASARHPLICALLTSYQAAIADPQNELVHLYEIRDALEKYFGDEDQTRAQLGISKAEWREFGRLTNGPLREGRHRGRHVGILRPATKAELRESREIAARWIEAFARSI